MSQNKNNKPNNQRNAKGNANKQNCNRNRGNKNESTNSGATLSTSNPYTWYANFPNFSKDVATLAFGHPVGQPLYFGEKDAITAAGICVLWYVPSVGTSSDNTSPINRQATRFQTYLRSIQRSAASYDAADSMLYMVAIDSLYAYWAYLRRAYGVAQLFTPVNKYYPRRLLQAMNIDPSVADDLSRFRAFINKFALNIGRYALPKKFDLAERHMWMNTGMYVDSTTTRAQTYMFCPEVLWKFNNLVETGSQLEPIQIHEEAPKTLDRLIEIGRLMMNSIENDDDTMNISGDIYRAYGPNELMSVEETTENYSILPVYDTTVLSQIENCTIVGGAKYKDWRIKQDPSINSGAIIFEPTMDVYTTPLENGGLGANVATNTKTPCINMHMDSPSAEAVMEATRLTARCSYLGHNYSKTAVQGGVESSGTEIIVQMDLAALNPDNPAAVRFLKVSTQTVYIERNDHVVAGAGHLEVLALLHQFDWAPMLYIVEYDKAASTEINVLQVDCDMDNFTMMKESQLDDIHEAALLSLLDIGVPSNKQ